jgi:hypothetical protein
MHGMGCDDSTVVRAAGTSRLDGSRDPGVNLHQISSAFGIVACCYQSATNEPMTAGDQDRE